VRDDVLDGFISVETARRDFGVVLTPEMTVHIAATTAARAAHPTESQALQARL
jgi:hypothetical protein